MTQSVEQWNAVYDDNAAPWLIGRPQPAIVELERAGWVRGRVLDPGCGAGEHTILLTELGYDVVGMDLSPSAIEYARRNAAAQGVPTARFEAADLLALGDAQAAPTYDTIVDSALFHIFGTEPENRAAYVRSLHALCKPGGTVHILALSDVEPGFGPRISDTLIRESFSEGWELEDLQPSKYHGTVTASVLGQDTGFDLPAGTAVELAAWQARLRRL